MAFDDRKANGSSGDGTAEEVKVSSGVSTTTSQTIDHPGISDEDAVGNSIDKQTMESIAAKAIDYVEPATHSSVQTTSALPSEISSATPATDDVAFLKRQLSELQNQVSDLNGKLVTSFNRVSDLEDDLSEAKEKAMSGTTRVAELEKERQEHLAALNTGLLVEKAHVSSEMQRMMDRVIEETKQRGQAESDKAKIESELDELSASLFGEANRMVAVERLARARADEKSRQMEERLQDTEGIMLEQQKVLGDLQRQLDHFRAAEESKQNIEDDGIDPASQAESSQTGASTHLSVKRGGTSIDLDPYHDRRLLMLDIVPYQELRSFLDHLRKLRKQLAPFYNWHYDPRKPNGVRVQSQPLDLASSNRTSSPVTGTTMQSMTSLTSQGLYSSYDSSSSAVPSSPFAIAGVSRHKDYPTLPSNCEQLVHIPSQLSLPFIKRSQEEDSDPCLRIDFAPGLNWLTRRSANTSVLEGSLLIEPLFPGGSVLDVEGVREQYRHLPPAACAMCGLLLLNIPLPGAEEAKSATGTPDLRTVSGWASSVAAATNSAALSLREATSAASKTDTTEKPALKSSRSSLFGSLNALRSKTGSPKPTQHSHAPVLETSESEAASQVPSVSQTAPLPLHDGPLPIPTHIFRISESSNVRYLLCPNHCLVRIRAACAFWSYIRHIERAVVLEGKLAWDDDKEGVHSAASGVIKPQPRRAQVASGSAVEGRPGGDATAQAPTDEKSDQALSVADGPSSTTSLAISGEEETDDPNNAATQSDDGFHDAEGGTATPLGEEAPASSPTDGTSAGPSVLSKEKGKPQILSLPNAVQEGVRAVQGIDGTSPVEGQEGQGRVSSPSPSTAAPGEIARPLTPVSRPGSAAPSVPPRRHRAPPAILGSNNAGAAAAAEASSSSLAVASPSASAGADGVVEGEGAGAGPTPTLPPSLPPLPRRPTNAGTSSLVPSSSSSSVTAIATKAALIPSRQASTSTSTTASASASASASLGPATRKTLRIDGTLMQGEKALLWEEKVYLEVLRLKRMMWEARIGVLE